VRNGANSKRVFHMTDGMLGRWVTRRYHCNWLQDQANALLDFFQHRFIDPTGGFLDLDDNGDPLDSEKQVHPIHIAARAVHCFAIGGLLGRPGAWNVVDHGMDYLWHHHRDRDNGGYFWSLGRDGPVESNKQGYGHAFVLLASASAKTVGHPLADRMLADITQILTTRFWEERHGAIAEEFTADWSPLAAGAYRGQNSNMHMTEAMMAAFEATGDRMYLTRAESIADLIIRRSAGPLGWRVAEHFDASWRLDKDYYHPNEMLRPAGTTPGHWLEWARLLLQLWVLGDKRHSWMPEAARELFSQSMALGWDRRNGGFFYTLDWNDAPAKRNKFWWPACEGIGAAHFLGEHLPSSFHEDSYRAIWNVIERYFIDHKNGGWHEELSEDMVPSHSLFPGKGDIYHAFQACLIPLFPATGSLTKVIVDGGARI
jgi:sulfoquinovose isomerase